MTDQQRHQLLLALHQNARLDMATLGAMVGLSEGEARAEVTRLEQEGVIARYLTVIDWEKLHLDQVRALVEVRLQPQREVGWDRLAERIGRYPEVKSVLLMSGAYDLLVQVEAPTLREVSRFVSERVATVPGVMGTTTHFLLKRYKDDGVMLSGAGDDDRQAVTP